MAKTGAKVREAVVPAAAAIGGMVVPALIFVGVNMLAAEPVVPCSTSTGSPVGAPTVV